MASFSVVVLDPGGKGGGACVVAGENLPVGPLGSQGAIEPLHLAVLPRTVRADEHLLGAKGEDYRADRVAVGPGVFGHYAFDPGDALVGEVGRGPGQEPGTGHPFLVRVNLGVRQTGVVIDQ